jgi:hypothetical protein
LNLANPALSKPPPTLSIMAIARREKNNCGMVLKRIVGSKFYSLARQNIGAKDQIKSQKQLPMLDQKSSYE